MIRIAPAGGGPRAAGLAALQAARVYGHFRREHFRISDFTPRTKFG